MHYLVTFHKQNSDKVLTESFAKLDTANRWKELVENDLNNYVVVAIEPKEGSL